jgi:acyl-CoA synthetase (AMP-forming)/AMP-acid ligase II/acyl carrier protein
MCCGAEPIRVDTLRRFAETFAPHGFDRGAIYPCYGMAETTLQATGRTRGDGYGTRELSRAALQANRIEQPRGRADANEIVGCGRTVLDERLAIVHPDTGARLGADQIGEIWVSGETIATAYWRNDEATETDLRARLPGADGVWLRTGDLGFLDASGELFVTGRIKEMIIVRGMNHYPQDIERSVQAAHPALRQNGGAAFSVADERGEEQLVIVQEVERTERNKIDPREITGLIREAVTNDHEIYARHIVLIRPGTLPKTTSGKIQRHLLEEDYVNGVYDAELKELAALRAAQEAAGGAKITSNEIERKIKDICDAALERNIDVNDNLFELGASSLKLIEIHEQIDRIYPGLVDLTELFDFPTIAELSRHLEGKLAATV